MSQATSTLGASSLCKAPAGRERRLRRRARPVLRCQEPAQQLLAPADDCGTLASRSSSLCARSSKQRALQHARCCSSL